MSGNLLVVSVASLALVLPAMASDRSEDVGRIEKATQADHSLQSLMSDKFKIGADTTVAAGPVGRDSVAGSVGKADIFTYTRSKGHLDGFSLDGTAVQADDSGNKAIYLANGRRATMFMAGAGRMAWTNPLKLATRRSRKLISVARQT